MHHTHIKESSEKLSLKTKVGFGICDVGGNLFFTVIAFQLALYLTDTAVLDARLMGIAMLIGRIVDSVTDPLMGYISDRTSSRWGRRRPYIFFGAILLSIRRLYRRGNPDRFAHAHHGVDNVLHC